MQEATQRMLNCKCEHSISYVSCSMHGDAMHIMRVHFLMRLPKLFLCKSTCIVLIAELDHTWFKLGYPKAARVRCKLVSFV